MCDGASIGGATGFALSGRVLPVCVSAARSASKSASISAPTSVEGVIAAVGADPSGCGSDAAGLGTPAADEGIFNTAAHFGHLSSKPGRPCGTNTRLPQSAQVTGTAVSRNEAMVRDASGMSLPLLYRLRLSWHPRKVSGLRISRWPVQHQEFEEIDQFLLGILLFHPLGHQRELADA